jgi:MoxR-like ATPase
VLPDDIRELAHPVLAHRLLLTPDAQFSGVSVDRVVAELFETVAPPTERVA